MVLTKGNLVIVTVFGVVLASALGKIIGRWEGRRAAEAYFETWGPAFAADRVNECVRTGGEPYRPWCSCIVSEASKHFARPAAFLKAASPDSATNPSPDERNALRNVAQACVHLRGQ